MLLFQRRCTTVAAWRIGMKIGLADTIEYTWLDGISRVAWFEDTYVESPNTPWQSTKNPWWHVRELVSGATTKVQWLQYLTQGAATWEASLICQGRVSGPPAPGEYIDATFEHRPILTSGSQHPENYMDFLDWGRQLWRAQLVALPSPGPVRPRFTLSKLH
jgi:hypothetical protein